MTVGAYLAAGSVVWLSTTSVAWFEAGISPRGEVSDEEQSPAASGATHSREESKGVLPFSPFHLTMRFSFFTSYSAQRGIGWTSGSTVVSPHRASLSAMIMCDLKPLTSSHMSVLFRSSSYSLQQEKNPRIFSAYTKAMLKGR